ncbi:putative sensory transduction regulator [Actinomycetospora succinea]|uniref:Putative sensory transduction regulator n=1 Tax=Actinomycetospora succinea TaxID=663603 RepID=A0A4R6UIM0_9PSEU|nr:YbjN domain-containing protein [Actinomycetospora succinea]TDQ46738.1 putative sensory transduction regulator [Actinomycetospora succinea]
MSAADAERSGAGPSKPDLEELEKVLVAALDERELTYLRRGPGRLFVTLPGTKKLATHCWLVLTPHALLVEAFVCRHADENLEEVYRFLLQRNARLYGVHYTIDRAGDIHLVGRVPLVAVVDEEIDKILGQVLEAADGDFNTLLELGFVTSIRREWAWRESRGESLANLSAFAHLVEDGRT